MYLIVQIKKKKKRLIVELPFGIHRQGALLSKKAANLFKSANPPFLENNACSQTR